MGVLAQLLAQNIKKYRKIKGYSQNELAEKCDISPNHIQSIETQKRFPSEDVMLNIADKLDISPYSLFETNNLWKERLVEKVKEAVDEALDENQ